MKNPTLSVLSYGAGQDSDTIKLLYLYNQEFRRNYAPNDFIMVFSDTGDEHPETYDHLSATTRLCQDHGIHFTAITPDMGYHPASWQSLQGFYDAKKAIGSKAFPKTCTDKLKIVPIYKWLENYLGETYQVKTGRKRGFYEFAERYGKIRVMVGIAKGEENRIAKEETQIWRKACIEMSYPLIDLGMDRQACQEYIASVGHPVPLPSNCRRCPFMSRQELLWLYRFQPQIYHDWVRQESVKIEANQHMGDRNLGVWGKKLLPEILVQAQAMYGHWSDDELWHYKMSHGHCVASKY